MVGLTAGLVIAAVGLAIGWVALRGVSDEDVADLIANIQPGTTGALLKWEPLVTRC